MKVQKLLKYAAAISVFIVAILFLVCKICEYDIWLHLSSGKYIVDNLKLPALDPFSYTAADRYYVDSHWLYQVILYFSHAAMGLTGIAIYQLLIFMGIFVIIYKEGEKNSYFATLTCILLTLLIANNRFLMRPEMFTYLCSALFILILDRVSKQKLKSVYFLPLIQVVWVNTHGLFVFGPIIILCYITGELIGNRVFNKKLFTVFILSIAACFVNPYGYKLALYPFILLSEIGGWASPYMKSIGELHPLMSTEKHNYRTYAYFIFLLISIISFITVYLSNKKINVSRLMIVSLFFINSIIAERNTVFFAFVISLIIIYNFNEIDEKKVLAGFKVPKSAYTVYLALLTALCIPLAYSIITNKYYKAEKTTGQFGFGKVDLLFPTGAIEFIKSNNIKGNIFNDALLGGYFIWNCYPERKVFVDGKMELYGEKFMGEYKNVIDNPAAFWQDIEKKYNINYVLLHPLSPHSKNIYKYLYSSKKWKLTYFDESGIVFTPAGMKIKPALKNLDLEKYNKLNKVLSMLSYANFFYNTGQYAQAKAMYVELIKNDPGNIEAYLNLGAVFLYEKKYEEARMAYKYVLRKTKKYPDAFLGLAIIYFETGYYEPALNNITFALRRKPIYPEAQKLLCYVYLKMENYDGMIAECNRILSRSPSDEKIYELLGVGYFRKGQYETALENLKKAHDLNPEDTEIKDKYYGCLEKVREIKK